MAYQRMRKNSVDTWAARTMDGAVHFIDLNEGDWWWLPGSGSWAYPLGPLERHFFHNPGLEVNVGRPIVLDVIRGSLEQPFVHATVTTPPVTELTRFSLDDDNLFARCVEGWSPFPALTGVAQ